MRIMKLSNMLLVATALGGLPVWFVEFSSLPMSAQIWWAGALIVGGISGVAAWAFERR